MTTSSSGTSFSVLFDATFDRTLTPGFVGTGTLSFDESLGDGSYALNSLTNLAFNFTVIGQSFTIADLFTDINPVNLVIYNSGTDFYFDGGLNDGPLGGTLGFIKGASVGADFEPNHGGFAPAPFNLYGVFDLGTSSIVFGTYGVVPSAAPEPSAVFLFAIGGLVMAARRFRR